MTTKSSQPAVAVGGGVSVARKGLRIGAIGPVASVVIAVASAAPAYSLTSALGSVVGQVGRTAPVTILLAFVPMVCISFAYKALNSVDPDCGTSFTWVARAFGRRTGWITGWVIVVADIIVMANLAETAGSYTFQLFGAYRMAASQGWTIAAGSVWVLLMTLIAWVGIELSARVQAVLLTLELLVLGVFSVVALIKVYTGHAGSLAIHPSWSWFNPFGGGTTFGSLSGGFLAGVFMYWGWDAAVAATEETVDTRVNPGRAAVLSTVILLTMYLWVSVAAQAYAGVGADGIGLTSGPASTDALSAIGRAALGTIGFKALVLAILSSAAASAQTVILPTARTALSMAAYRALPRVFGDIHPRFLTPTVATWATGGLSVTFYVVMAYLDHGAALGDLVLAIGLQIAFYYGLTGFAAAWYFRRELRNDARTLWLKGILPVTGGLILFGAFADNAFTLWQAHSGATSFHGVGGPLLLGVGSITLGIPLMLAWNRTDPAFFRGHTMANSDALLENTQSRD